MRRTRRSPAARDEGRRLDGVETARDSGRRAERGGVTEAPPLLREQIGQLASRRLWRQKVGTHPQSRTDGGPPREAGAAARGAPFPATRAARSAKGSASRRSYRWQERARLRCTTV